MCHVLSCVTYSSHSQAWEPVWELGRLLCKFLFSCLRLFNRFIICPLLDSERSGYCSADCCHTDFVQHELMLQFPVNRPITRLIFKLYNCLPISQFKATNVRGEIQCTQKHQLSGDWELRLFLLNQISFLWSLIFSFPPNPAARGISACSLLRVTA